MTGYNDEHENEHHLRTSPTEQTPAAGVEAVAYRCRSTYDYRWEFWPEADLTAALATGYRTPAPVEALYPQPAIDALRATIADLEARLRTARADAWREGRDAAVKIVVKHSNDGGSSWRLTSRVANEIRALNPPEKPHDAS